MPTLTICHEDAVHSVPVPVGTTVLEGLHMGGYPHAEAPCGGSGRCGRCLVPITGEISPVSAREQALLQPGESRRLACLTTIQGDCRVTLHTTHTKVAVDSGTAPFPADGTGTGLGAAVDIGTTTVVLYLYDIATGRQLAVASGPNAQSWAGADVISRIQYTMQHTDGLDALSQAIRQQLDTLLRQACREAGVSTSSITQVSVAGNTVLEHLLDGLSPAGIAAAPFMPASLFGCTRPATKYHLPVDPGASLYLAPCISGYVGGDITAGLTAIRAAEAQAPVLLVDVGTNGEMALGDRRGITCCSTAAGPAFEGATLSCGMSAASGAIDKVWLDDNGALCYSVLGGGAPRGLCGSGLVDALAVLLRLGIVEETGRMVSPSEAPASHQDRLAGSGNQTRFYLSSQVWISAEDVRKLQLAKAAIAAGIQTLLETTGVSEEQISAFYLAGGFGSYLRPESGAEIGLFPNSLLPKLQVVGNSAGAGASSLLYSASAQNLLNETVRRCTYLELSGSPLFNDAYLDAMMFE